jgi:hypothetical protein
MYYLNGIIFLCLLLGTEPRALHMLGKCSASELCPQTLNGVRSDVLKYNVIKQKDFCNIILQLTHHS